MPIAINGTGTITGITAGGLPDASIEDADIAAVASGKLTGTIADARLPTVPVAKGGTGLTAAGASGQVLTSDGTNWASSAAGGGLSSKAVVGSTDIAVNGTFDITFGFQPTIVLFHAILNSGNGYNWGIADRVNSVEHALIGYQYSGIGTIQFSNTNLGIGILSSDNYTNRTQFNVTSWTASSSTAITITKVKSGSPTGTAKYWFLGIK